MRIAFVVIDKNLKMALCRMATPIIKLTKPVLVNSCVLAPGSVNMQVRYAARKGYREKIRREKKNEIKSVGIAKETTKMRKKVVIFEKTVDLKKPDPPADDVIIRDNFNYVKYSLSEAVKLHREYHHPTIYNNPNAPIHLRLEINMIGKTQFQFLKPFSGIAAIPNPFAVSNAREILVLCNSEDVDLALSSGASVAGGDEIVEKIKEGVIQPSMYEYVISHVNFHPQLTPIRQFLKNKMPKIKQGTLTDDLRTAIHRFLYGIEYSCMQGGASKETGFIHCTVGLISMELDQLEENLSALIKDIEKNKVQKEEDFISWIWCTSPPSDERFSLDLSKYRGTTKDLSGDDDDNDDGDGDGGGEGDGDNVKGDMKESQN